MTIQNWKMRKEGFIIFSVLMIRSIDNIKDINWKDEVVIERTTENLCDYKKRV